MPAIRRKTTILVLWAVNWALALIGFVFVFKGNPVKNWIESVLLLSESPSGSGSGSGSGNLDDKLALAARQNLQTASDLKTFEQKWPANASPGTHKLR
jgi:hypothetical protein